MSLHAKKDALLSKLSAAIEQCPDAADRQFLHTLNAALYQRFSPADLLQRSVRDMYGSLRDLLAFIREGAPAEPRLQLFNPQLQRDGWDSPYTTLTVLCRAMPFVTASVRAELNRRNLHMHTVASANLQAVFDASGALQEFAAAEAGARIEAQRLSLVFIEMAKPSDEQELADLTTGLLEILGEVSLVIGDFPAMRAQLRNATVEVAASQCVDREAREEAQAFLEWLHQEHMILLGYEYLEVEQGLARVSGKRSLGLLRRRDTRGVADIEADLKRIAPAHLRARPLSFSKSRQRSRVHRLAYPDYVEIKVFDDGGEVVGQHRFLGLYTAPVYSMDPRQIPILRCKVEQVLEMSRLEWSEHERRELLRVLQVFPRDELFQSSVDELCVTANAINGIQERRQTRLFIRKDVHGKFVNCLVYVPRDLYNTEQRLRIESILRDAFQAQDLEFTAYYSESILVRCHFVLRVDPNQSLECNTARLEQDIIHAMLAWEDRLRLLLVEEFGEQKGQTYFADFGAAFPPGYRDDCLPQTAVQDLAQVLALRGGRTLGIRLYRGDSNEVKDSLLLKLYHPDHSLPLSDVLPILENLGLRVLTERPYAITERSGSRFWVQEFTLEYSLDHDIRVDDVREEFEDAFALIWFGEAENDCFNRLLLGSRLNWREIALLRAYARYLRQLRFPYSVEYIAGTLANHLPITSLIVELFLTRFSPVFQGDDAWREQREVELEQKIVAALEGVSNLGEDRIIRQFDRVVNATLRTNFFQQSEDGSLKSYFSFKLRPADIPDVPQPVPMFETYVYSPRVEGVHLRGGKVARGGLRWSDRLEDFRTEVLGLVKAQQVKNAVIVPVGAKGGFVARQLRPDMTRAEVQEEGIACYEIFIRGLLDLVDNRVGDEVVGPRHVVTKDDEDPYLVVAADKGTATFSDIANRISAEYAFWLGDAFASGGSAGYDHKKMGITARGAWVSVQRHFREMGIDVQSVDFTVIGIGDMAGDVFGNGMLQSPHIRLVAAFNHLHIFIDPDPDPAASFAERQRLFCLPRSGWMDYDPQLISAGGGVFERSAKSIALSRQIKHLLDIEADTVTPSELISHLLRAPVDLLWNGGIGTYVKAEAETHAAAGDKANDALRVNATELRCQVIGEGGNLGLTQLGRIEYCLNGGRCNTDFIDNAAGVDCSDHEVNIKILLNEVVTRGDLSLEQRNALLEEMTDNVAALVLRNNYRQTQAISLIEHQAEARSGEYLRFLQAFEQAGRLNRKLEFMPTDEELLERYARGDFLTRPEISVLVSYTKASLKQELIDAELDHDLYLARAVETAFPERLVELYGEDVQRHRLHREIQATQIANEIVNRLGLNFVLRQQKATGAAVGDVARAYAAVMEIYRLPQWWQEIEALDHQVASGVQQGMMVNLIRLVKRATRWLLRNRRRELAPQQLVAQFGPGLRELGQALPTALRGDAAELYQGAVEALEEAGVPTALARAVAGAHHGYTALGIIEAARLAQVPLMDVAHLYFYLGERLSLDWFGAQILSADVQTEWQALARDTYLEDLEWQQRTLAIGALRHMCADRNLLTCLDSWEQQEAVLLSRWQAMLIELKAAPAPDFAMLAVANRELLDLAQSTTQAQ